MRYLKFVFALSLMFITASAFAASDLSMFKTVYEIKPLELVKPTVVSVSLPEEERYGVSIIEEGNEIPQPWLKIQKYGEGVEVTVITTSQIIGPKELLVDRNWETSTEFNLDKDKGKANIELSTSKPITSNSLTLYLDDHVALPYEIALSAFVNDEWKTVVAYKRMDRTSISFPEITSDRWKIELTHGQPLRIREISLGEKNETGEKEGIEIRWLARPEMSYTLYTNASTYFSQSTAERGELEGKNLEVKILDIGESKPNPIFQEPDDDKDGVPNLIDNCVSLVNTNQEDIDKNGRGDVCEDFDGDNVINNKDNCPDYPNMNQADEDGDGIGNVCDKEESRLTEQNKWLPWAAMGITAIIVLLIVIQTIKNKD